MELDNGVNEFKRNLLQGPKTCSKIYLSPKKNKT